MRIVLNPGEEVTVEFADSDGEIAVGFYSNEISVYSNLPDSDGRVGLIYCERLRIADDADEMS